MKKYFFLLILQLLILLTSACSDQTDVNKTIAKTPQNNLFFANLNTKKISLSKKEENTHRKNYLTHYFSPWDNPWLDHDLASIREAEESVIQAFQKTPGFGVNAYPHTEAWINEIADNMNLSKLPNQHQPAITLHTCNLRMMPTVKPIFDDPKAPGQGYPFDDLQVSLLAANEPVYILHSSKDGAWNLIVTPHDSFGWLKNEDIAIATHAFRKRWKTGKYIVITKDHSTITTSNRHFLIAARQGNLFPLIKTSKNHYHVLAARANLQGHAITIDGKIDKSNAGIFPLKLTQTKIAELANHLIGEPYGWGGLYGYRDCSATTEDLFAPFGIWLPRNSTDQALTGYFYSLTDLSDEEKEKFIQKKAIPFLTLIWKHGHIMLYVGSYQNKTYIFNNLWGLATKRLFHSTTGRLVIGRTVIMPLNLGQESINIKHSLLNKVQGITLLINR